MRSLNEFFDKIYCIHVDGYTERYDMVETFRKQHNCDINYFDAYTPKDLDIPKSMNIKVGEYACTYSHMKLWEQIKLDNPTRPLILEDDIVLTENINLFDELEKTKDIIFNQDVDLLYLGSNNLESKRTHIRYNLYKVSNAYATHAYSPTISLLNRFDTEFNLNIENVKMNTSNQIDVNMAHIQSFINCITFKPSLVYQPAGYSIVNDMVMNNLQCFK